MTATRRDGVRSGEGSEKPRMVWMARSVLNFPNPSRSYDAVQHRVRFWGYDSALEVSFFMEESALMRLDPKTEAVETAILATFDAALDRIHDVAKKVHSFDKQPYHVLVAGDF